MTLETKTKVNERLWTVYRETCGVAVHLMETKLGTVQLANSFTHIFSLRFFFQRPKVTLDYTECWRLCCIA